MNDDVQSHSRTILLIVASLEFISTFVLLLMLVGAWMTRDIPFSISNV